MTKRWGIALLVVGGLTSAACSSSSSSQGVVSTTAAPAAAPVTEAPASSEPAAPDDSAAPPDTQAAPASSDAPASQQGGTVTVGLDSEPPTLDPAANSLSLANGSVYGALYEGLMINAPGKPLEFGLAESLTESDDRLSWTLVLKPGVTFHDGTPMNAEAVKFNLERQKASLFNGSGLIQLSSVEVVDELTATLTLATPWTALPSVLAGVNGLMVSPTAAADAEAFKRKPVGTGPYELVEWSSSDKAVLKRFDGYWGDPAPLDELVFKFIAIEAARVAAFEAGELDAFTTIVVATEEDAAAGGAQVTSPPPTGYGMTYYNLTRPPFDDVRVRQALALASDRDAISAAYQGQTFAEASQSPLFTDSEWWAEPAVRDSFDPEAAKALLDDYGQPVKFTFKLLSGSQEIEDAVRATIEYWKEIGIEAELQMVPDLATYVTDVVTGNYDAVGWLAGSSGDPDTVLYNLLHSGGASNYGKYSNPEMDALLDQGRVSNDDAERKQIYADVQALFREDLPISISSHGQIYIVSSPELTGLDPDFFFPSRTVARG
jgi:peptide/nickel transport system substrate-binding protein